jgi:predicted DsbA family dithiol-disulfide isomerase
MAKRLEIQIWSDLACPWCYVGKRRFEAALAEFAHRDQVSVTWRSFQLDPGAPPVRDKQAYAERLARKYGSSVPHAQAMILRMVGVAAADGLTFDFENIQPGNTFDAHRLLHLARERGTQDALKERLFRAYLEQGRAIGDHATLLSLAGEVGLDVDEAQAVLATERFAREVRLDEAEARALGVDGVPFFVIANRYSVAGAQPAALLRSALEKAWAELPELTAVGQHPGDATADGALCGPDGCA